MPDVEYMLFCCREAETCDYRVRAKTKEEAMERARAHMSSAHGMKEIPKDKERQMEESIKPVKVEE